MTGVLATQKFRQSDCINSEFFVYRYFLRRALLS